MRFDFAEKFPSEIPIVVLDTETTGLHPGLGHRVVEIGAVRLENWHVAAEISQLIQPDRPMEPGASRVNGIYDNDLVGQPRFGDVADRLLELIDGALLVAHNAVFDAGFVGMEFFIDGRYPHTPTPQPVLPNPWLCTLQLARRHFHFGRNNLGHIARHLGVRTGRAHRALNDVYMTAAILQRMVHELEKQCLHTVGDLLHAQGPPIYTPVPPRFDLPGSVAEALDRRARLRILYISEHGEANRVITPLYAAQHQGRAYLIAYCHTREAQRTFRLDRIFSAQLVD